MVELTVEGIERIARSAIRGRLRRGVRPIRRSGVRSQMAARGYARIALRPRCSVARRG
jgi:hypothetical protein